MPTVDLDLGPQSSAGQPTLNPLGAISTVTDIQSKLLAQQQAQQQIQLTAQQLAARQRFGQIVATAPDIETGLQRASQDPMVAPYSGEWIGQYRQALLADQQYQNERQKGAREGVSDVTSALKGGIGDPSMISSAIDAKLAALSPYARSRATEAANSLKTALTANLPSDPDEARRIVTQRNIALSGATPDEVHGILGTPTSKDLGGSVAAGVEAPPQGIGNIPGGAFIPSTITSKGVPSSVETTAGGAYVTKPGVTGGVTLPASSASNALQPAEGINATGGNGLGTPPSPLPAPTAGASAQPPAPGAPLPPQPVGKAPPGDPFDTKTYGTAGDGKPLIADPKSSAATGISPYNRGLNLGPLETEQAKHMIDKFSDEGPGDLQRAQIGLAQTREVDADLDKLNSAGGWQVPGAFGNFRNSLVKVVQTLEQATGQKLDIDPTATASYEQLNKDTRRLGLSLLTSTLGNQHEAAQTIEGITSAVPSVDNTYLGAKLVNASIRAQFNYATDQYNYVNAVARINGGDIRGAYEQFAKEHPAEQYAQQVLDQFSQANGVKLTQGKNGIGFASFNDLKSAVANGLLSRDEARTIAKEQFPDQMK